MLDTNWDLIDGNVAHEIEVLNYSNQVNVIDALVRYIMHHAGPSPMGCSQHPNEQALKELHRTGTLFLLAKPGEYREEEVHVGRADGTVVHTPPTLDQIRPCMDDFFARLTATWSASDPVQVASLALWMLNWIHPFKNGNGRAARAFSYACMCLRFGFILPGSPTVIDLIMRNRDEYQDALKAADLTYESSGQPDLTKMNDFVRRLLTIQLTSVPPPAAP